MRCDGDLLCKVGIANCTNSAWKIFDEILHLALQDKRRCPLNKSFYCVLMPALNSEIFWLLPTLCWSYLFIVIILISCNTWTAFCTWLIVWRMERTRGKILYALSYCFFSFSVCPVVGVDRTYSCMVDLFLSQIFIYDCIICILSHHTNSWSSWLSFWLFMEFHLFVIPNNPSLSLCISYCVVCDYIIQSPTTFIHINGIYLSKRISVPRDHPQLSKLFLVQWLIS
jgi:hypothetical protein